MLNYFLNVVYFNKRSKTWVELTEAKLNYMIGETDAVLRSMCLEASPLSSPVLSSSSEDNNDHHHHHHTDDAISHPRRSINQLTVETTTNIASPHEFSSSGTLDEMTRLYLDNFKQQLEESRKELSQRMDLLEQEKEKISKMTDTRKRELYMRRRAAIEAFRLERERELRSAQLAKIDELRSKLGELNSGGEYYGDEAIDVSVDDLGKQNILLYKK